MTAAWTLQLDVFGPVNRTGADMAALAGAVDELGRVDGVGEDQVQFEFQAQEVGQARQFLGILGAIGACC